MSFLFINKTLRLNKLKTRLIKNAKISAFVICVEVIIYLLLYNLHDKDENYYKTISYDPTHEHMKIGNGIMETFHRQQILAKNITDNLKTTNVKTPHFYPSVHEMPLRDLNQISIERDISKAS